MDKNDNGGLKSAEPCVIIITVVEKCAFQEKKSVHFVTGRHIKRAE